jgi:glycosyltransferase involved in cell wall biosynthesis
MEARCKKMNLLILNNGWLTKMAGGDYHILNVSKFWAKKHKIYFILPELGYKYGKAFFKNAMTIYRYKTLLEDKANSFFSIILLYFLRVFYSFFIRPKQNFNVVVSSSHFFYDVIPSIFFKLRYKSKLIVYIHGPPIFEPKTLKHFILVFHNRLILFLIRKFADNVFVINPLTKSILMLLGFDNTKVTITSNGISLNEIPKKEFKKKYTACFMGRLVKQKGVYDLIKIWKLVVEFIPNAKLIILGHGPEEKKLKEIIQKEKLQKNIFLLGYKIGKEKYKYLKQSRIFIFPSHKESWSISIMEAIACGLPVVAYDLPEYKKIYGKKIITVNLLDIKHFSSKVLKILENERIYPSLTDWAQKYDWEKIANSQILKIEKTVFS